MPTYKVNKMDTRTKSWAGASTIIADSLVAAIQILITGFSGMKVRRTRHGFTVKEAGIKVVVSEDHSAVP